MKIYIVTANDIEDSYPEAAFSTHDLAMEYLIKKNDGKPLTQHPYYGKGNYAETHSFIVELELDSGNPSIGKES